MEKIDSLGIDIKEIENVLARGMKFKERDSEKWCANMAGLECVFLKDGDAIFVITVYQNGRSQ